MGTVARRNGPLLSVAAYHCRCVVKMLEGSHTVKKRSKICHRGKNSKSVCPNRRSTSGHGGWKIQQRRASRSLESLSSTCLYLDEILKTTGDDNGLASGRHPIANSKIKTCGGHGVSWPIRNLDYIQGSIRIPLYSRCLEVAAWDRFHDSWLTEL